MSRLSITKPSTRVAMIATIAITSLGMSGCRHNQLGSGFNQTIARCFAEKRARHRAACAWDRCPDRCASDHVREGFIDGYVNVALGGRGCTPAVAPSKYWGWPYSGIEGQRAGADWLQGYPLGALAGEGERASYQIATLNVPTEQEYRSQNSFEESAYDSTHRDPGPDTIDDTILFPPAYLDNPSEPSKVDDVDAPDDDKKDADPAAAKPREDAAEATDPIRTQAVRDTVNKPVSQLPSPIVSGDAIQKSDATKHLPPPPKAPLVVIKNKRPVEQPVNQPVKKPVVSDVVVKQPVASLVNQPITKPAKQPSSKTVKPPVPQPAKLPAKQSNSKSVKPSVEQSTKRPVARPIKVAEKTVDNVVEQIADDVPEMKLEPNDEVFGFGIE